MSRSRKQLSASTSGFPRVSGDEPCTSVAEVATFPFSPRERG